MSLIDFARPRRNTFITIISSFILAYFSLELLIYLDGPFLETPEIVSFHTSSVDPTQFQLTIMTTGPSYFHSVGRVYCFLYSPYIDYIEEFGLKISIDQSTWYEVPLYSAIPDRSNLENYVDLGLIDLKGPLIILYGEYYNPPQNVTLPGKITYDEFSNSFKGYIHFKKLSSPEDIVIRILVHLSLWGLILRILDMVFLKKYN